jgi:hypothetical protein
MSTERDKWISKFTGHFGEPIGLQEYRDGTKSFREMRDESLRYANGLLAEVEYYNMAMFDDESTDEEEGKEGV